jgi:hypothetical protein
LASKAAWASATFLAHRLATRWPLEHAFPSNMAGAFSSHAFSILMWRPSCQAMWSRTVRHHATSSGWTRVGLIQRGMYTVARRDVVAPVRRHAPADVIRYVGWMSGRNATHASASLLSQCSAALRVIDRTRSSGARPLMPK